MSKNISVAIDGPGGAGKSTVAKAIAKRFGFIYVDTGAIYRTVGLAVKRAGAEPKSSAEVTPLLKNLKIELDYDSEGSQRMLLNGEDVSGLIRTPEMSLYASDVSALSEVRNFLLNMQRDMALKHNVVMDGRDIGTVVLPEARVKIFLTAAPEERARRRYEELR
ncbi:MAG: (d)CMP kinase, partial [Papillibacter sp.]|nr:(d)CMP kinase [Papillibacter sp.]